MSFSIVERARRYVAKCPPAISGQGGHNATFRVAALLVHGFALGEVDALALLREWNGYCQPPWSEAELRHKVASAGTATHREPRGYLVDADSMDGPDPAGQRMTDLSLPPQREKPSFQPMVLKRIAAKAPVNDMLTFLARRSPVPVEVQNCASFLRWLYPPGSGERVLVFSLMQSQGQMLWKADRSDLVFNEDFPTGSDGVWFLPQPVDGEFRMIPRLGKVSRRAEESVTAWRYAVLESDEAEPADWLRCLVQMPLRIASICESGGRSIHALVRVDAVSKADWDTQVGSIKPVLVTLGADAGALSAVRLTRLPQAMRGERLQRLLYLNPEPDGTPILRRPVRGVEYGMGVERIKISA